MRGMQRGVAVLLLALTTGAVGPVALAAQTDSPELETHQQAVQWLARNQSSPQLGSVLLRAVTSAPTVRDAENLVERHLERVTNRSERAAVLMQLGMILELANRYGEARTAYARALEASPAMWSASLRHAALAIEQGDLSEGVLILTRTINQAPSRDLQRQAALLRARAHALGGETDRAFTHLADLVGYRGPDSAMADAGLVEDEALFLFHEVATVRSDTAARDWAADALTARGRFLPEAMLATPGGNADAAEFYPTPSRVLGGILDTRPMATRSTDSRPSGTRGPGAATDTAPGDSGAAAPAPSSSTPVAGGQDAPADDAAVSAIQTGSFRDAENARYMAEDIRAIGFAATVETAETANGTFYRVLVPMPAGSTPADAQRQVVELKERGIEGFLVFQSR